MRPGQALAEQVAAEALRHTGRDPEPEIDIDGLAATLGVVVRSGSMAEHGRLLIAGDSACILLNAEQPSARLRFTLAHELGHWLLHGDVVDRTLAENARDAFGSEEYLCDKIAAGILMPASWVERCYQAAPQRLGSVIDLAETAEVSLSAALVRLRDVLGWRASLLQWVCDAGTWVLEAEAGLFPAQQGLVRTTESTRWTFTSTVTRAIVRQPLELRFGGEDVALEAEIRVTGARAVALLRLPYPDPITGSRTPFRLRQHPGRSLPSVSAAIRHGSRA